MTNYNAYECHLTPKTQHRALKELGEKPERRQQDIEYIRQWLQSSPHLNADLSDGNILSFLRVSKYSLEKTKQRLELYYTVKTATPEFFANYDPLCAQTQHMLASGSLVPLKGRDFEGQRVLVARSGMVEPDKITVQNMIRAGNVVMAAMLQEWEDLSIDGLVIIMDFKRSNSSYVPQVTPTLAKKGATILQDCHPIRIKAIHFINTSAFFEALYTIAKPFADEKLKKNFHFHGDKVKELKKVIPEDILPNEYGGKGGSFKELNEEWKKTVESKRDWLIEQQNYKSDESKRPGPKKDMSRELFGMEGSFRKLEID